MADINELLPEPGERIFICGKTGSGKTTLAEYICRPFPYVIAFDAKRMLGMSRDGKRRVGWLEYKRVKSWSEFLKAVNKLKLDRTFAYPKIIYVPTPAELRDDRVINAFFELIYNRGNCVAYIDELSSVTNRTQLPSCYHDCLVRGRELGISMFQSSQRPVDIPVNCIESSERYYLFKVKAPQDQKRIHDITACYENFVELPKRRFFYVTEEGEKRGPLTLDLKEKQKG